MRFSMQNQNTPRNCASNVHLLDLRDNKHTLISSSIFPVVSMCRSLDTGLVLVMFMTLSMILTVACLLSLVKYEACPVLFKNNTVSQNNERNVNAEVKSIECNKKFSLYY